MRACQRELDPVALWEYALGFPGGDDASELHAHLDQCASCRRALAELTTTSTAVGLALPPLAPSPATREQLLLATRPGRFDALLERVGAFFDLTPARARRLAARLDDDRFWMPGGVPGLRVAHVRPGPAHAGAYAGLLRLAAGARFPLHVHAGSEDSLVLAGGFAGDDGRALHPGMSLHMGPGSRHTFVALDGDDCIAGVIVRGALEFADPKADG